MFVGLDEDLDYVEKLLKDKYELKVRGRLGSGQNDKKSIDMLGRTIKLHEWGITWEGDGRHRKLIMEQFGLCENSKILTKNGYKDEEDEESSPKKLNVHEIKAYRTLAARMNYMAQDNLAIQFAAKEVCRRMSSPDEEDFARAKRLARFIVGVVAVEWEYPWQEEEETKVVRALVDSDWAGCRRTRRSTSGGILMIGRHPVKTWSVTQATVATSSAEAELYAMAEGASRGLGMKTILEELGVAHGLHHEALQGNDTTRSSCKLAGEGTAGLDEELHADAGGAGHNVMLARGAPATYLVQPQSPTRKDVQLH